jgi:pimeloyl-ACP methyl ester carboxylesterase
MTTSKLYMIPGTGADWRMYMPQLDRFPDLIVPQWLPPVARKEPIASYAKRLSAEIDTSQPFFLGGTSLGGMIAQEMAKELKPLGLILIATCSDSKAIPLIWRISGKVTRITPDFIVKWWFKRLSACAKRADPARFPHKDTYAQMLLDMPPALVRWQSGASTEWGLTSPLPIPVFHIHSGRDKVIPLARITKPQRVIENGGHLINVTHAAAVNDFIISCLESKI